MAQSIGQFTFINAADGFFQRATILDLTADNINALSLTFGDSTVTMLTVDDLIVNNSFTFPGMFNPPNISTSGMLTVDGQSTFNDNVDINGDLEVENLQVNVNANVDGELVVGGNLLSVTPGLVQVDTGVAPVNPTDVVTLQYLPPPGGPPDPHASTHLTAGSDPIQIATSGQEGLMSAAFATLLTNATSDPTNNTLAQRNGSGQISVSNVVYGIVPGQNVILGSGTQNASRAVNFPDNLTGNDIFVTQAATQSIQNKTMNIANGNNLEAVSVRGVTVTPAAPSVGQILTATAVNSASWQTPVQPPPIAHASSHLSAGSDAIQLATDAQEGLMSAAFGALLTNATSGPTNNTLALRNGSGQIGVSNVVYGTVPGQNVVLGSGTQGASRTVNFPDNLIGNDTVITLAATQTVQNKTLDIANGNVVEASSIRGVGIGAVTPTAGQVLTATAPSVAAWQDPVNPPPIAHASTHLTAGSDPIQLATSGQEGLMSAAFAELLTLATASGLSDRLALRNGFGQISVASLILGATSGQQIVVSPGVQSPSRTVSMPNNLSANDNFVLRSETQTIANKTLTIADGNDVEATTVRGVDVNAAAPVAGQVLTATAANAAEWQTLPSDGGVGNFSSLTVSGLTTLDGATVMNDTATFNDSVTINDTLTVSGNPVNTTSPVRFTDIGNEFYNANSTGVNLTVFREFTSFTRFTGAGYGGVVTLKGYFTLSVQTPANAANLIFEIPANVDGLIVGDSIGLAPSGQGTTFIIRYVGSTPQRFQIEVPAGDTSGGVVPVAFCLDYPALI